MSPLLGLYTAIAFVGLVVGQLSAHDDYHDLRSEERFRYHVFAFLAAIGWPVLAVGAIAYFVLYKLVAALVRWVVWEFENARAFIKLNTKTPIKPPHNTQAQGPHRTPAPACGECGQFLKECK